MNLYHFIENCLSGQNSNWNYYNLDYPVENILQPDASLNFIRRYFVAGEKILPLLIDPNASVHFLENDSTYISDDENLLVSTDPRYALPAERATHTVSGFFLGLLIEECMQGNHTLAIDFPDMFPFRYFWFLTYLYHDIGYCVAEKDNAPLVLPTNIPVPSRDAPINSSEYRLLRQAKKALEIQLSPFTSFSYHDSYQSSTHPLCINRAILRELTQRSCTVRRKSGLNFNTGTTVHDHQYRSSVVTRYFNYHADRWKTPNHGIIGGYLFYDRIIKNYLAAYLSVQQEHNTPILLNNFYSNGKHFSENQLVVFSYIADCIIAHNIWALDEENRQYYDKYNLSVALGYNFKFISFRTNPLLYILAVADTLEPTKIYKNLPAKLVAESIDICYSPKSCKLTFSSNNKTTPIELLHKKAKGLEAWTSARCDEINDGKFILHL